MQSQELSQQELELALKVLNKALEKEPAVMVLPPELKHLNELDWLMISGLLDELKDERKSHSLQ